MQNQMVFLQECFATFGANVRSQRTASIGMSLIVKNQSMLSNKALAATLAKMRFCLLLGGNLNEKCIILNRTIYSRHNDFIPVQYFVGSVLFELLDEFAVAEPIFEEWLVVGPLEPAADGFLGEPLEPVAEWYLDGVSGFAVAGRLGKNVVGSDVDVNSLPHQSK